MLLNYNTPSHFYKGTRVGAKQPQSRPTLATPRTVARQAPLSVGFSRQEYWSGLPCPPPGDLSDPGIEPIEEFNNIIEVCSPEDEMAGWHPRLDGREFG